MSTTQTLTEQAHDEETTPKPKTRVTKKKMITFDQKTTKDVVFKKKDEDFQRKVLGLTIPDIAPKKVTGKDGKVRTVRKRPTPESIAAQRVFKARYYRRQSSNMKRAFPRFATLKKAVNNLEKVVAIQYVALTETDMDAEPQTIRVEDPVIYKIRHGLTVWLAPLLAKVNILVKFVKKTVVRPDYLFAEIISYIMEPSNAKFKDDMLSSVDKLEKKVEYNESTIIIAGENVPVQRIYSGAALDSLFAKSNLFSKNSYMQHAINRLATIWLYHMINDSYFSMQKIGKKTLTTRHLNMFLTHSAKCKVFG